MCFCEWSDQIQAPLMLFCDLMLRIWQGFTQRQFLHAFLFPYLSAAASDLSAASMRSGKHKVPDHASSTVFGMEESHPYTVYTVDLLVINSLVCHFHIHTLLILALS